MLSFMFFLLPNIGVECRVHLILARRGLTATDNRQLEQQEAFIAYILITVQTS